MKRISWLIIGPLFLAFFLIELIFAISFAMILLVVGCNKDTRWPWEGFVEAHGEMIGFINGEVARFKRKKNE